MLMHAMEVLKILKYPTREFDYRDTCVCVAAYLASFFFEMIHLPLSML